MKQFIGSNNADVSGTLFSAVLSFPNAHVFTDILLSLVGVGKGTVTLEYNIGSGWQSLLVPLPLPSEGVLQLSLPLPELAPQSAPRSVRALFTKSVAVDVISACLSYDLR